MIGLTPLGYFVGQRNITAEATNLLLDSLNGDSAASENPDSLGAVAEALDPLDRNIVNLSFGVGERLQFDINYGFINAGSAEMSVVDLIEWEERPAFLVRTLAHSNSFFTSIFPVNDTVETIIDANGLFSWHFEKRIREGSYRADEIYTFDQRNHLALMADDTVAVSPFTQDVLSSFYFVRTMDLEVGQSVFVESYSRDKPSQLEVKVLRRETVQVPAGKFECIVVEPLLSAAGIFRHEGRLTVWLTDDRLKMPVLMKSKVIVGAISASLTGFQLGEIEEF